MSTSRARAGESTAAARMAGLSLAAEAGNPKNQPYFTIAQSKSLTDSPSTPTYYQLACHIKGSDGRQITIVPISHFSKPAISLDHNFVLWKISDSSHAATYYEYEQTLLDAKDAISKKNIAKTKEIARIVGKALTYWKLAGSRDYKVLNVEKENTHATYTQLFYFYIALATQNSDTIEKLLKILNKDKKLDGSTYSVSDLLEIKIPYHECSIESPSMFKLTEAVQYNRFKNSQMPGFSFNLNIPIGRSGPHMDCEHHKRDAKQAILKLEAKLQKLEKSTPIDPTAIETTKKELEEKKAAVEASKQEAKKRERESKAVLEEIRAREAKIEAAKK